MISAKDELHHLADCMSEEECERALELLRQAGMTGPLDEEPDEPTTVEDKR
jgi:hypothetical protein